MIKIILACLALASYCQGSFLGLFKSKVCYELVGCFNISEPFTNSLGDLPSSPEDVGLTLTLFTQTGPANGESLDYKDGGSALKTKFNPSKDIKIIIHGYMDDGSETWNAKMVQTFLSVGDFNVIRVAWGPGSHQLYQKSVANTRVVGAAVGYFLTSLKRELNVSMSQVHLIGHSLGSHISGYVGSRVPQIARITGLDPAGPFYENVSPEVRIDPTDAQFVDCIHSNGEPLQDLGFGTSKAWCDVDFYPNGGAYQPGCPPPYGGALGDVFSLKFSSLPLEVSCSHGRSHDLFISSIKQCQFQSAPCADYDTYNSGKYPCSTSQSAPCVRMGYHTIDANPLPSGKYYLNTTATTPFC